MKSPRKYILFLSNRYTSKENLFYLGLLPGRVKVAVDGGVRFFLKNKVIPDILIGDFDSSPPLSEKYRSNVETIIHRREKDKTDAHLALELAMKRGAKEIIICGAISVDEIDHTLGNIFLLQQVNDFNRCHNKNINAEILEPGKVSLKLLERSAW